MNRLVDSPGIRDDAAKASRQDTLIGPGYNFSIGAPRNFSSRELARLMQRFSGSAVVGGVFG